MNWEYPVALPLGDFLAVFLKDRYFTEKKRHRHHIGLLAGRPRDQVQDLVMCEMLLDILAESETHESELDDFLKRSSEKR